MKKGIALLASLFIANGNATSINLNVGGCKLQKTVQKESFGCQCDGGSGDYDWHFSQLPDGWRADKDIIFAPNGRFQENKVYGARVQVLDKKSKQSTKRSLFFRFKDGKIGNIVDHDFDFDVKDIVQRRESVDEKGRSVQKRRPELDRVRNIFEGASGIGGGAGLTRIRSYFSGNGLYKGDDKNPYRERLPQIDELNKVIGGDSVKDLKQLLVNAARGRASCRSKAQFIEYTLRAIRNRIAHFKDDVETSKKFVASTTQQLKYLQTQLKQAQQHEVTLKQMIAELQRLKQDEKKLTEFKANLFRTLKQSEDEIQTLQRQISRQVEIVRRAKQEQRLRAERGAAIDNRIAKLQAQLDKARKDKAQFLKSAQGNAAVVAEANLKIQNANKKIAAIKVIIIETKTKIKTAVSDAEALSLKIVEAERNAKSLDKRQRADEIRIQITEIQKRLEATKARLAKIEPLYKEFRENYDDLEKIGQNNFNVCYKNLFNGSEDLFRQGDNDEIQFAGRQHFRKYINQIFRRNENERNIRGESQQKERGRGSSNEKIRVRRTHILSKEWKETHGSPFDDRYDAKSGHRFDQDDFDCDINNVLNLTSFKGKVVSISKNLVKVLNEQGKQCEVYLGGCTRIETANKKLPSAGDKIHWKGTHKGQGGYNAHHVTCE